ncbi:MAG: hypothetical protein L3J83_03165 [Proteobacteria bacterium]|nr:hypothetical protein [Pseudomonadota bacterium]
MNLINGRNKYITTRDISELLGVHQRTAQNLCNKWLEDGFIIQHGQANKSRKYELATKWLALI